MLSGLKQIKYPDPLVHSGSPDEEGTGLTGLPDLARGRFPPVTGIENAGELLSSFYVSPCLTMRGQGVMSNILCTVKELSRDINTCFRTRVLN